MKRNDWGRQRQRICPGGEGEASAPPSQPPSLPTLSPHLSPLRWCLGNGDGRDHRRIAGGAKEGGVRCGNKCTGMSPLPAHAQAAAGGAAG